MKPKKHIDDCPNCGKHSIEWTVQLTEEGVRVTIKKCPFCGHQVRDIFEFTKNNKT